MLVRWRDREIDDGESPGLRGIPEPADAESGIAPAFADARAAEYLGRHPHQLYLYRRGKKAEGPPFVMHGTRVRYPRCKGFSADGPHRCRAVHHPR